MERSSILDRDTDKFGPRSFPVSAAKKTKFSNFSD